MDRTSKILLQLDLMMKENWFEAELKEQIISLVKGVNAGEINLMDFRKHDSQERFRKDVVEAIILADLRVQYPPIS